MPHQQSSSSVSAVSQDIAQLRAYIAMPYPPQHVQWQVVDHTPAQRSPLPGGYRYALVAVLNFTPTQLEQLKTLSGNAPQNGKLLSEALNIQPWLPAPIQAATTELADTPGYVTINAPGYSAEPFILPGAGWKPGYWVQVGDSAQILLLLAKNW